LHHALTDSRGAGGVGAPRRSVDTIAETLLAIADEVIQ
jgi:hypothetical protein